MRTHRQRLSTILCLTFAACWALAALAQTPPPTPATADTTPPPATRGQLKLSIKPAADKDLKPAETLIRSSRFFEAVIEEINKSVKLPRDIEVVFDTCDEANAFYSEEDVQILICYELVADTHAIFFDDKETRDDADTYALESTLFTFLHELGHALIHQLKIPIAGKEEDAADELATLLLLQKPAGGDAVLSALEHFWVEADAELASAMDELEFWDEHSLSVQRFYSIACLLYGSNAEEYEDLLVGEDGDGLIPPERADLCPDEYDLKKQSWSLLLKDHMHAL